MSVTSRASRSRQTGGVALVDAGRLRCTRVVASPISANAVVIDCLAFLNRAPVFSAVLYPMLLLSFYALQLSSDCNGEVFSLFTSIYFTIVTLATIGYEYVYLIVSYKRLSFRM